jgi:hypothetical protein
MEKARHAGIYKRGSRYAVIEQPRSACDASFAGLMVLTDHRPAA